MYCIVYVVSLNLTENFWQCICAKGFKLVQPVLVQKCIFIVYVLTKYRIELIGLIVSLFIIIIIIINKIIVILFCINRY